MASPVLFSIRRMLGLVAVIAGMCASLRYANPTMVLVVQTGTLIAAVTLAVLAISGAPRTRRFSIAALAAGLIHLFVFNLNTIYELAGQPGVSPTSYCCHVLYNWVKAADPSYGPVGTVVPSAYSSPSSYSPPYAVSPSAYPPGSPTYVTGTPTYTEPTFAPTFADPNGEEPTPTNPEAAPPPAFEPGPPALRSPVGSPPTIVAPAPMVSTPVPIAVPNGVMVYPSYTTVGPTTYTPDWWSFEQVGALDATLLIGLVAGSAAMMLDDLRRRRVRSAVQREKTAGA